MIDFPAAPTDGQIFSSAPNGVIYKYSAAYSSWLAQNPTPPIGGTGDFCAIHNTTWNLTGTLAIMIPNTVVNGNAGVWYNATTGRYTPPAGRYRIVVAGSPFNAGATVGASNFQIRKNGTSINQQGATTAASAAAVVSCEATVDANGTDYFEAWGVTAASTGQITNLTFDAFPLTGLQGPTGQPGQTVTFETGAMATGTTLIPADDTIPQQTEGDQYMSLSITPRSATSKLIIDVVFVCANSITNHIAVALFQDATANALAAVLQTISSGGYQATISFRHVMTSGTTSATTFKVRAGGLSGVAGTLTFNGVTGGRFFGGVMASSIVITEAAP